MRALRVAVAVDPADAADRAVVAGDAVDAADLAVQIEVFDGEWLRHGSTRGDSNRTLRPMALDRRRRHSPCPSAAVSGVAQASRRRRGSFVPDAGSSCLNVSGSGEPRSLRRATLALSRLTKD